MAITDIEDLGIDRAALAHIQGDDYERIIELAAFVSEKAYRRGFQQGYWAANESATAPDLKDLWAWRRTHTLTEAVSPYIGERGTMANERLRADCGDELDWVFIAPA